MSHAASYWIAVLAALAAAASLHADITETDFLKIGQIHEAESLLHKGKHDQAQEAFEKLAADASSDVGKSQFLARAAIALGTKEGGYESGLEEAKAIEHAPYAVYAQLEIMREGEQYETIVEQFKDEPIGDWPDYEVPPVTTTRKSWQTSWQDVKMYAYRARGTAFYETGDAEAADRDLQQAADLFKVDRRGDQWMKLEMLMMAIRNAAQNLEDEQKAAELRMRVVQEIDQFQGKSQYMGIVSTVANRLREEGKFDEALDVLGRARLNVRNGASSWFAVGHLAYGRVYAAKAKAQEAEVERLRNADRTEEAAALLKQARKNKEKATSRFRTLAKESEAREGHRKAAEEALDALR